MIKYYIVVYCEFAENFRAIGAMYMKKNKQIMLVLLGLLICLIGFIIFHVDIDRGVISTTYSSEHSADENIKAALSRLPREDSKAEIIEKIDTEKNVIALVFQGLSDTKTIEQILDLLAKHEHKVDFVVSGIAAAERPKLVQNLYARGHNVGSNTLSQSRHMHEWSKEELVDDFVRANTILKNIIKKQPSILMCSNTIYTDEVLNAAYVSGNKNIVQATKYLSYQSFKDYEQVLNYMKKLDRGTILTVKLDGVLHEGEYDFEPDFDKSSKPIVAKQPDKMYEHMPIDKLTSEERLINLVCWLLQAIDETDYKIVPVEDLKVYIMPRSISDYANTDSISSDKILTVEPVDNVAYYKHFDKAFLEKLRIENDGKKAVEHGTIYTTEKALAYAFYGINNIHILDEVLTNLDLINAKGTFYITEKDLINNPDVIKELAKKGHEIGIALIEAQSGDYYSTLATILSIQTGVKKLTNQHPTFVRFPYDMNLSDEILEAVSSANCSVIWQDITVATSKVGIEGTLDAVMENIFGEGNITVRRGYIIYFRLDYYNDPKIIPDAVLRIYTEKVNPIAYNDEIVDNGSAYSIKTIGEIMGGERVYNYPLKDEELLPSVKNVIFHGHLSNLTTAQKFDLIKNRYIGNPDTSSPDTLPGFTDEELGVIDKTGVFTDKGILFLTFDDWASDKAINHLLYVLDKHRVKGNFFIRTNYMQNNPNILRAIAEAGHDVGSHSDGHLPFAIKEEGQIATDTKNIYRSLNEEEILERRKDLVLSYNKLKAVIGDISIDDKPALTTIFRPPTLAMSKVGMEEILDMGFTYIVSGDFSTHDYEDTDPYILRDKILYGKVTEGGRKVELQNGSILIMHMSDFKQNPLSHPNVTAKALDLLIPILKDKGYSFGRLSDYLTEGGDLFEDRRP